MYRSPIEVIYEQAKTQMENDIFQAVQSYAINVDKDELIRALRYDRGQYDKGYADGKTAANEKLVRCKDCSHWKEAAHKEFHYCIYAMLGRVTKQDDFCSCGVRRCSE